MTVIEVLKLASEHLAKHSSDSSRLDAELLLTRTTMAYPDFAADVLEKGDLDERRVCKTLTFCTYLMRQKDHPLGQFPTGCPPFDKDGYGEIMKEARAAQRGRAS